MDTLINSSTVAVVEGLKYLGLDNTSIELDNYLRIFRSSGPNGEEFRMLQPIWDWRLGWERQVASPLFPIVVSVLVYFVCMLPWMVIDMFGSEWKWIQRYKIQPDKELTWLSMRKAMMLTFWNHILYILPISVAQWVWTPDTVLPVEAPELWDFCWQQYAALMIFDLEYYIWHFVHHKVRFLYKHVHGVHHQYHATSVWVTQYLHPWELISVGIFTTTSPWFFNCHPMTQTNFMVFSILVSVEAHLGYDLPFMPHHWAPFWGGGIKHDMHHQKPLSNYQPFFNWFDRLFDTECPGQLAGGYKPPQLLDWEKRQKDDVSKRLDEKRERAERQAIQRKIEEKLQAMKKSMATEEKK